MEAYIECLEGTRGKYELKADKTCFVLDRMLKRKWVASYGFIPDTLQADGDELDVYVIGKKIKQGLVKNIFPVCLIYNVDNGQIDNKLVCAASTAGRAIRSKVKKISRFVSKYKKNSFVPLVTWRWESIKFELAKCKAYAKLFKEV